MSKSFAALFSSMFLVVVVKVAGMQVEAQASRSTLFESGKLLLLDAHRCLAILDMWLQGFLQALSVCGAQHRHAS